MKNYLELAGSDGNLERQALCLGPLVSWDCFPIQKGKPRQLRCGQKYHDPGLPCGAVVRSPPANAGDMGSRPGLGRSHMLQSN